ncbi:SMP-30/gluconolactonase/LRE family protein [Micromonospora sp. DR5-3]|uniref:SMP-30/gluconolactonase/LRE family protein n=1 Tax=unclassified Micromonospora TaxID=2617518 RepID=UPI0011DA15D1|nr:MULTISPECIES: SMP-30/gluconolactonase/LRE family protein [unclassified Micromonospora]MCW3819143.1 SMP-30/gluconolactonase/LRE family protein [Micromonospora sp. DR5-3]TYC21820.1 SMP-30/gluconolactonase/LRE family protein [Micromonospora sp. MP36]
MLAEQVTPPIAGHGEGPVWCPEDQQVLWVDMLVGDILALDPVTGAITRRHVAPVVAAVRPRSGGGLVAAVERGFALLRGDSVELLPEIWSDPSVRMNDGGCDPLGRFYCGSMAYDAAPGRAALHRLSPGGAVETVLTGLTVSNGLAWTRDGRTAWYVDSATHRIDTFAFDLSTGELQDRRPGVAVPPDAGTPDGLCVDVEGGVWVALWNGAAVHRYAPDGRLTAVVELPVRRPTACAFGGPDHADLYITTSRQGLPAEDRSPAGALFRIRPEVPGFPDHTFAG